jgi:hypothetical protein
MVKHLLYIVALLTGLGAHAQINYDGIMAESYWAVPHATAAGGPTPCNGLGNTLNSFYAVANDNELFFGVGGNVQAGNNLLLFLDTKPGGYNNGDFGRTNAPKGLANFNSANRFDAGFTPDYCLSITTAGGQGVFTFSLYTLSGSAALGGGQNLELGTASTIAPNISTTIKLSCHPSNSDFTNGFELGLPKNILGYNSLLQDQVKIMAMIITDGGEISNQFLTKANINEGCYGNGPINFATASPNPINFNPTQTLPIDFLKVYVRQIGDVIRMYWSSAIEKEMKEYQIERSTEAITFSQIGKVLAKGNTAIVTDYDFADPAPIIGKNYYRIKAIDKTGRSTYSSVIKINYGRVDNTLIIYPNPVKDEINLQIVAIKPGTYDLEIFNDAGQKLITKSIVYNGGYGLQQIPLLPNMTKGPYRLILKNKAVFYKQQFIVQ